MEQTYKEPGWKKIIDRIGTTILINSLFLLCCIPLVTIGSAWCGLYSAVRSYVRGEKWFQAFKNGFSHKFLPTTLVWTVCMLLGGYMLANTVTIAYYRAENFWMPLIASSIMTAFVLMFIAALFPVRAFCTGSTVQWIKCTMTLSLRAPLQSLIVAVLMWLPLVLVPMMFMFGAASLLLIMTFYYAMVVMIALILYKRTIRKLRMELEDNKNSDRGV